MMPWQTPPIRFVDPNLSTVSGIRGFAALLYPEEAQENRQAAIPIRAQLA
jgi:hypothetical protein